jgi:lysine 2,3-aminomutase
MIEPWQDGLASAITTEAELDKLITLASAERDGIRACAASFPMRISRYYAGLMDTADPACPIRRQAIPNMEELADPWGSPDPIGEEAATVAPNLIRLYGDRVAWCVSGACATNCRFCFRRGSLQTAQASRPQTAGYESALAFISKTPEIRDVLLTGGEPLLLPDEALDSILSDARKISHVEIIRIGTRVPVTLPRRITPGLCTMLRKHHPLWINTHFNHPRELTREAVGACAMLSDAGIPLGNQSVLLKGVNDDPTVMKTLVQCLVKARVRPYYLFQCHLNLGSAPFRTPIETGLDIVSGLRGSTTGFAVPLFIVDTPRGKIAVNPQTLISRDAKAVTLRAPDGSLWREPNLRE